MRPLVLTLGEPAGVGPEIIAASWRALSTEAAPFAVIGDADLMRRQGVPVAEIMTPADAAYRFASALPVIHRPLPRPVEVGRPDPANAPSVADGIEEAVSFALSGEASGVVTAPIAKAPMYASGFRFPGHTEFIAELTADAPYPGTRGPVMMLTAKDLRACLVTIHVPIDQLPDPSKFNIHSDGGDHCYIGLRASLCHGWASGPTSWLTAHVLGIQVIEPGVKAVRIRPHLGELKFAEGTLPTPYGEIYVKHTKQPDGSVTSEIKAPKEVRVVR